jgi:alpha-tubulin suppressor-like RCC1 family protein
MGNNLSAVNLGTDLTANQVSSGTAHTCTILDDDEVKCWGTNESGELGLGDTQKRGDEVGEMGDNLPEVNLGTDRTASEITVGGSQSCATLDNGELKCWGGNGDGELGLGDTDDRGDETGEMGDDLSTVDLGTSRTAATVAAGSEHTCALLDNGEVKCWGENVDGKLGLGDTESRGDEPGEMGDNLPAVDLSTNRTAAQIAVGDAHTCALSENGDIKCWGSGDEGGLGLGDTENRGDDSGEMGDDLPTVDLGAGRTAVDIAAGGSHTCAVLDNGEVKCWGQNFSGQLGLGDTNHRGDEPGEMGDNLPVVSLGTDRTAAQVITGESHTCVRFESKEVLGT